MGRMDAPPQDLAGLAREAHHLDIRPIGLAQQLGIEQFRLVASARGAELCGLRRLRHLCRQLSIRVRQSREKSLQPREH